MKTRILFLILFFCFVSSGGCLSEVEEESVLQANAHQMPLEAWRHVMHSLESPHPYAVSYVQKWTIAHPGADKIRLHFKAFETEKGYDEVRIFASQGNKPLATYSGNLGAFTTEAFSTDQLTISFESDQTIIGFGFAIDYYEIIDSDPSGVEVQWAKSFGDKWSEDHLVVAHDSAGNVFLAGTINEGSLDFGGALLQHQGVGKNTFLASFDAQGQHRWSKLFFTPRVLGNTNPDIEAGSIVPYAIATDPKGNVYLAGEFHISQHYSGIPHNAVDFGGGPLTAHGKQSLFLASFDSQGAHRFSESGGGSFNADKAQALAIDSQGYLYLAGEASWADVNANPLCPQKTSGALFVARLDSFGHAIWCKGFVEPTQGFVEEMNGIAVDSAGTAVYLAGTFANQLTNTPGAPISYGKTDAFLMRLDAKTGAHGWSKHFGGNGNDRGVRLVLDNANHLYFAGTFEGQASMGGQALVAQGKSDIFLASFNALTGATQWSKSLGSVSKHEYWEFPYQLASNASGDIYLGGSFAGYLDLTSKRVYSMDPDGLDGFIAKFDAQGNDLWLRQFASGSAAAVIQSLSYDLNHKRLISAGTFFARGQGATKADLGEGLMFPFAGSTDGLLLSSRD